MELAVYNIKKVVVRFLVFSKTRLMRDNPYWTTGKNSFEGIELSAINKVSLDFPRVVTLD